MSRGRYVLCPACGSEIDARGLGGHRRGLSCAASQRANLLIAEGWVCLGTRQAGTTLRETFNALVDLGLQIEVRTEVTGYRPASGFGRTKASIVPESWVRRWFRGAYDWAREIVGTLHAPRGSATPEDRLLVRELVLILRPLVDASKSQAELEAFVASLALRAEARRDEHDPF